MSENLITLVESMITRASSVSDLERLESTLKLCHDKALKALRNVTVGYEPEPATLLPEPPPDPPMPDLEPAEAPRTRRAAR